MRTANLKNLFAAWILSLVIICTASGDIIYVNPGESIQAAIDSASYGDTVEVSEGTYIEWITLKNGVAVSGAGAAVTIINGFGGAPVVTSNGCDANTVLEGFTITNGLAVEGGGMRNYLSSPTVTNCIFSGNSAIDGGGGMANSDNSSPTVTNCIFIGNTVTIGLNLGGGGMYNDNSSPTLTNCTFFGNSSEFWAGGMLNYYSSSKVTNCTFIGNSSTYNGGGIFNWISSSATVTNCTFSGNLSGGLGGGIFNWISSSATVTNCTFSGNLSGYGPGGGMANYSDSVTVTNCVLWDDSPDEICNYEGSIPNVTYSDVEGGTGQPWFGTGCIDIDPDFVNAAGGDFRLSSSASQCVDAGANAPGLPSIDLAGNPRVVDGDRDGTATVDMGAFELQCRSIHNITQNRWYEILQASIDDAQNGDQIEVGAGTYNEAINFKGKAVKLYSRKGPEFTIINGTGNYHVVKCISGEGRNTVLEGFTIRGGHAMGTEIPDNSGGGILCVLSSPTIVNCIISENVAVHGGGIYGSYSNLAIIGCKISENWGTLTGGGLYFYWFYPVVINCEIRENWTNYGGGGMVSDHSQPTITNSTFSNNSAVEGGSGALASFADSIVDTPYITNCIFWGDTPPEIAYATFPPFVQYCDVQGTVWPLAGNISVDPQFANAAGGNLQLSPGSPCIDKGQNVVDTDVYTPDVQPLPEDDLNGSPRIYPSVVDMGAYEHRDSDGDGITDGFDTPSVYNLTRGTDHFTIQAAINGASWGDEIEVSPGTYHEAINFLGKAIRLYSRDGPETTIIDGNGIAGVYHVIQCVSGEDANTILKGFTITGGNANGSSYTDRYGGGMYNVSSSPTVTNCIVRHNKADLGGGMLNVDCAPTLTACTFENNTASGAIGGGGMYNHNSSPLVTNCTFIGNSGESWGGGGMFNAVGSNPTLISCTFSNNSAVGGGGGIYNWHDTMPILINCTFRGNSATGYGGGIFNINNSRPTVTGCSFSANTSQFGGGIYSESSSPAITNCVFRNNNATNSGGGMCDSNGIPTIINCTFTTNTATSYGGGIYNEGESTCTVTNCILWADTAGIAGNEIYDSLPGSSDVSYSDVQGHSIYPGTENINADPCFVDAGGGDFRISVTSPCIDRGSNAAVPSGINEDLNGNPRIIDGDCNDTEVVDMGAYEFSFAYIGDFDGDCDVDFLDYSVLGLSWLLQEGQTGYEPMCDISLPPDKLVDCNDLTIFIENWLAGTEPE